MISGRNIASLTPVCLRNRQADPQRINRRTAKEWRFLLKVIGSCPLPPMQTSFPQNVSWRLHPEISRGISENERNPLYGRQAFGLKKGRKAELENLPINTCLERGNSDGAIKNYLTGKPQEPSYSFNDVTYYSSLNDNILNWGLWVEITYPRWIYENQIVAFLRCQKQRVHSRYQDFCDLLKLKKGGTSSPSVISSKTPPFPLMALPFFPLR